MKKLLKEVMKKMTNQMKKLLAVQPILLSFQKMKIQILLLLTKRVWMLKILEYQNLNVYHIFQTGDVVLLSVIFHREFTFVV